MVCSCCCGTLDSSDDSSAVVPPQSPVCGGGCSCCTCRQKHFGFLVVPSPVLSTALWQRAACTEVTASVESGSEGVGEAVDESAPAQASSAQAASGRKHANGPHRRQLRQHRRRRPQRAGLEWRRGWPRHGQRRRLLAAEKRRRRRTVRAGS